MKKKLPKLPKFSTVLFFIMIFFVSWANVPKDIPIKFSHGKIKINTKIPVLSIDTEIFGKKFHKDFQTKLGLDLKGGSHLLFQADITKIPKADREEAINSARNIIERRVNFYGVSEPTVQTITSGNTYRISVDLPGADNISEAIKLIGQTAQLTFNEEATVEAKIATQTPVFLRLTKQTGLSGKDVKKASVQFDSSGGMPVVNLEFNKKGAILFEEITGRNIGKPVGIFIDNLILSAPVVQQKITGGSAIITGQFSLDEAKNLATAINSGALPIPVKLIEQRNIGPTLGREAIQKSMIAGIVGLSSVILFMVIYYGRLGMIASFGLIIYGLISMAVFRAIPIVFTLPGIAGFILSIGMAVDSNILIFERIKEEQRKGKDFQVAFTIGFGKAIDAIKDANIATLLVAFILFNPLNWDFFPQFGLIRGFALTLSIGVVTSLFTGVVITKKIIQIVFIKYTYFYFLISIVVLSIGIFSTIRNGFIFGIDFTGGSIIEYSFNKNITEPEIKDQIKPDSFEIISVNSIKEKNLAIRTSPINETQEIQLRKKIKETFLTDVRLLRFDSVGPALGKETVKKTFFASVIALIGILMYVSFTFKKFSFGISASIATIHDFLILIGMYSLLSGFFSAEVDALFITAVLTTMSFSVHDTIVVFDKIRDYKKTSALSIETLANKALTETMVRSINNSLTIILMLIPLVVLGTESIRFFAAALLIGTITGTYSSPFIAVPLLVILEKKK